MVKTIASGNRYYIYLDEAMDSLSSVSKKEVVSISLDITEAASLRNTPPWALQNTPFIITSRSKARVNMWM